MVIPNIKTITRKMILPSTGKEVEYTSMTSIIEKELGRIKDTYKNVFLEISKNLKDEDKAKKALAVETRDMTLELIEALQPCFPTLDLQTITEGDLEMIQVELKRRCVDDVLDLQIKCPKCEEYNRVVLDLNQITFKKVELEKTIILEDGSELIITHIPFLVMIKNINEDTTELQLEFDDLVYSFKTLKFKNGDTFDIIDLVNSSYEEKIDWAFTKGNLKMEQREQIIDFLNDESPGIEPIELKIDKCVNRLYNGKKISTHDFNVLTEQDAKNRVKCLEEEKEFIPEVSKVTLCGKSYKSTVYSLSKYISFF